MGTGFVNVDHFVYVSGDVDVCFSRYANWYVPANKDPSFPSPVIVIDIAELASEMTLS